MTAILEDGRILLDIDAPVPKRWRDAIGPLRVMAGPVEGYVMVRRPGANPFVLRVSDLCNATKLAPHGPFQIVAKTLPTSHNERSGR